MSTSSWNKNVLTRSSQTNISSSKNVGRNKSTLEGQARPQSELSNFSSQVPATRLSSVNDVEIQPSRDWVLYWMTAFRRTRSNFALQYARDVARELGKPLLVLEALRVRYRWASERFHRFIIEGMRDNAAALNGSTVEYFPYVESQPGQGSGLVAALAERACMVVTDEYPCFFHPHMLRLASRTLPARVVAVDANCLMPLRVADRTFTVAHSYRRWMQKTLPEHLQYPPEPNPLDGRAIRGLQPFGDLPKSITKRWPKADFGKLLAEDGLQSLPIDHIVQPGPLQGGPREAERLLQRFVGQRLEGYDDARNEPDEFGSSELSPYLHFGQISSHEVFFRVMQTEDWNPSKIEKPNGKVNGFWGVSQGLEAFLDQLCTWREIGFNMTFREPNYARFESLPPWAQQTLQLHSDDERPHRYSLAQFEQAQTHDKIWNAAQRQLVREGRIHNYLRMLWGKKILHWSSTPHEALKILIELNNKYALDGRDPNSYSGIFWVLGRYDRAWGPEREIFGKVRYMTSENTAKKHALKEYLQRYSTF